MARTIPRIRIEKAKAEYIRTGGNAYKALKAAGLAEATARHNIGDDNTLLNTVKAEVAQEVDKAKLADKAWLRLGKNVNSEKESISNAAAIAILDFTEGKKSKQEAEVTLKDQQAELDRVRRVLLEKSLITN